MTTLVGPTIVATPDAISQVSAPSAWTMAISLSLRAASIAAMWARPLPTTKMCSRLGELGGEVVRDRLGGGDGRFGVIGGVQDRRHELFAPRPLEQTDQQELRGDERRREGLGHDRHVTGATRRHEDHATPRAVNVDPRDVHDPDDRYASLPRLGDRDDVPELP